MPLAVLGVVILVAILAWVILLLSRRPSLGEDVRFDVAIPGETWSIEDDEDGTRVVLDLPPRTVQGVGIRPVRLVRRVGWVGALHSAKRALRKTAAIRESAILQFVEQGNTKYPRSFTCDVCGRADTCRLAFGEKNADGFCMVTGKHDGGFRDE